MYGTYTKHSRYIRGSYVPIYVRLLLYKFIIYCSTYFKLDKYTKKTNLNDLKNKSNKSKNILNNLYVIDNIYFL